MFQDLGVPDVIRYNPVSHIHSIDIVLANLAGVGPDTGLVLASMLDNSVTFAHLPCKATKKMIEANERTRK